jgi:ATP-dependent RNA helicase DeaD
MDVPPFSSLGLPDLLLSSVEALGFEAPSPIQALAIPPALAGGDLIGLSETGSGKTAAFTLPALAKIDLSNPNPQVLILTPTRELAVQVCEEVHKLAKHLKGLRAIPVYGGAPIDRQLRYLRQGAHLIVGTPGRMLDHLSRNSFDPTGITLAVLDEADRMLDMGFRDDIEEILGSLAPKHQTLFFSATMNRAVEGLINRFGNNPETISIKRKSLTVDSVSQRYYEVRGRSKIEVLSRILDIEQPKLAIIFCNTKRVVDECNESLLTRGYSADRLHGDLTQQMRERVLKRFRDGGIEILVATDVAARGLDVDDVDIVVNFDLPQDPEDYVHRIGRTGRAGKSGSAVSFVFGRDIYRLQTIERYIKQKIDHARIPSLEEVEGKQADALFDSLRDLLESGGYDPHGGYLERLLEQGHTATDIAGALFSMIRGLTTRETEKIVEDTPKGERPKREKRERRDDRPDRRDERPSRRGERPERQHAQSSGDQVSLFLSLGKSHGLAAGEIAGMLYREAGLPDGSLGRISMFPRHSLIDVPADLATHIMDATRGAKLRGQPFKLAPDRQS